MWMWWWVANEKKKKTVNPNRRVLYKLQTNGKKNTFQTETRASREETKPFIQWICDFFFSTHMTENMPFFKPREADSVVHIEETMKKCMTTKRNAQITDHNIHLCLVRDLFHYYFYFFSVVNLKNYVQLQAYVKRWREKIKSTKS